MIDSWSNTFILIIHPSYLHLIHNSPPSHCHPTDLHTCHTLQYSLFLDFHSLCHYLLTPQLLSSTPHSIFVHSHLPVLTHTLDSLTTSALALLIAIRAGFQERRMSCSTSMCLINPVIMQAKRRNSTRIIACLKCSPQTKIDGSHRSKENTVNLAPKCLLPR